MKILTINVLLLMATVLPLHAGQIQEPTQHSEQAYEQCQQLIQQTSPDSKLTNQKAFTACSVAAQRGHPKAQYQLALMHYKGNGTAQDYVLAHMWFNLAAQQGDHRAQAIMEHLSTKMTPCQVLEARSLANTHELILTPCPQSETVRENFGP